jgi:hypothetical protein
LVKVDAAVGIDWTQCELTECVPGKVSGRPVVRGTSGASRAESVLASCYLGTQRNEQ